MGDQHLASAIFLSHLAMKLPGVLVSRNPNQRDLRRHEPIPNPDLARRSTPARRRRPGTPLLLGAGSVYTDQPAESPDHHELSLVPAGRIAGWAARLWNEGFAVRTKQLWGGRILELLHSAELGPVVHRHPRLD